MPFPEHIALALPVAVAYFLLQPFGYGYVGAELATAYFAWCTIDRWDIVNESLTTMLVERGL